MNDYLLDNVNDIPVEAITQAQNNGATSQATPQRPGHEGRDMEDTRKTAMTSSVKNSAGTQPSRENRLTENQSDYTSKYSHRSASNLTRQPQTVQYLIKGLLKRKGLHMLFGESGCGKSFMMLDMAVAIASPDIDTWNGKKVHHGGVVYFCAEGADGLNARFTACCDKYGLDPDRVQLDIFDEVFKLNGNDSDHTLETTLQEIKAVYSQPALVIFDTLNIFMDGDENSASDAGDFLSACRKIIAECGCSVLVVHHTGLSEENKKRSRGSSAFKAAMDISIGLSAGTTAEDGKKLLTLTVDKSKDGKAGEQLLFNLTPAPVRDWLDEDGEPVISCVVKLAEKVMEWRKQQEAEKKKPKLNTSQKFALDTYKETAKATGEIITTNNTGRQIVKVSDENWRNYFFEHSPSTNPDTKKDKETKRRKYNLAKEYLTQTTKLLEIKNESGTEFYCMDFSGNADPSYKAEIQTAIHEWRKTEAEAEAKSADTDRDATLELPLKV